MLKGNDQHGAYLFQIERLTTVSISDMFKVSEYKARIAELEAQLSPEMRNAERLKQELGSLESQKANLSRLLELMEAKRKKLEAENGSLCIQIGEKTRELASLDDEPLFRNLVFISLGSSLPIRRIIRRPSLLVGRSRRRQ